MTPETMNCPQITANGQRSIDFLIRFVRFVGSTKFGTADHRHPAVYASQRKRASLKYSSYSF